jgi:hypothetical protein
MKLHHTVAIAPVFWLLMMPPLHEGKADLTAPLRHWHVMGHLYDSSKDCEGDRVTVVATAKSISENSVAPWLKIPLSGPQIAEVKKAEESARCISSEDPSL